MKNVRKVTASLIAALFVVSLWSAASRSQDGRRQGSLLDDRATRTVLPAEKDPQAKPDAMSAEEKTVRDVYARLMRYQSASRDESDARDGKQSGPEDYLTFELRNIHSGSIKEIYDRPLGELVTPQNEPLITIRPVYLSEKNGPAHAYYEAESALQPGAAAQPEDANVSKEQPADAGLKDEPGFADFNGYTSYEVRVHFQGKQFTYRALALYQINKGEQQQAVRPALLKILDNIISDMNTVYSDESPRVRSPWNKYVKTSLYLAVARTIKETKEAGKPLIPADAPIGYLPGDDVSPSEKDAQTLAANAECPAGPRITGSANVWWFSGERPANYDTSITLTASPPGASSYSWSAVSGADKIVLSNFTGNTARVTGVNPSTFHEVGIQVTVDGVTSPTFSLSVRAPHRLVLIRDFEQMANTSGVYYETHIHYRIEDQFTDVLPSDVDLNEHFTTAAIDDFAGNNWNKTLTEGGALVHPSDWYDRITGPDNVSPNPPATAPCSPHLCTTKVYHWNGEWNIGSSTIGHGRRVQTNVWERWTDHAEHTSRQSPP